MRIIIELPVVSACDATKCAYNAGGGCHARTITVGDAVTPVCKTFFVAPQRAGSKATRAGVSACSMSSCRYNVDYGCSADAVRVGVGAGVGEPECLTFEARTSA